MDRPSALTLNSGEVHVWFAFPDKINDPGLLKSYHALLNEAEREKCSRYYFERDRHTCLITRALVRSVLSRYTGKPSADLSFINNRYGRPEFAGEDDASPVRFNLAHTEGLVACAVTRNHDVGIDVENTVAKEVNLNVIDRFFAPAEVMALRSLPQDEQKKRFYDYWTLKESLTKAWGRGLALSLDKFSFTITADRVISVSFDASLDAQPHDWQFFLLKPTTEHTAAISIDKAKSPNLQISMRTNIPLKSDKLFTCEILGKSR